MAQQNPVYDQDSDDKPTHHSLPSEDRPQAAGKPADPGAYDPQKTPKGDSSDPRSELNQAEQNPGDSGASSNENAKSSSPSDLAESESSSGSPEGYWNGSEESSGVFSGLKQQFSRKKAKRNSIVAAVGLTVLGGGSIVYFALIPLKIEHMVSNIQSTFFASSEEATGNMTEKMLRKYIINNVLPSYKKCGSTINRKCSVKVSGITGSNPVSDLYRTWADARLENRLALKYGIEFEYSKSGVWKIKTQGTKNHAGDSIGPNGEGLEREFNSRSEVRAAVSEAVKKDTRWHQVMHRYKVGRLMEVKYGIRRCIIFCGTRDALADKTDLKKKAFKLFLTQRVIQPRSETLGIVMECLLDPSCRPEDTKPSDSPTEAGAPQSETDTQTRSKLAQLAQSYGGDASTLEDAYKHINEKGYKNYLIKTALEKVGLGAVSAQVADAVPVIGWINTISNVINGLDKLGPSIKKLSYVVNSTAAVQLFTMAQTYADEVHTGHIDPTELGSFVTSLSAGDHGTDSDPQIGGTAKAESTPLYQSLIEHKQPGMGNSTALNGNLLPKASAASTNASNTPNEYKCADGKPPSELVCSEEKLGQGSDAADSVNKFLNSKGVNIITEAAKAISSVGAAISNALGSLFSHIPFVKDVSELISKAINPIFEDIVNQIVPSPFSTSMSGGRTFDMMAAGGDVAGNDYAHSGLGGQKLTPEQTATIINRQRYQAENSFMRQSYYARMFDTNSDYSLATKLAMAIPFGKQSQIQSSVANITNPFKAIAVSFGDMLGGRAGAAVTASPDPFGVTQYGYPDGTIPDDPEAYWEANCSDNAAYGYRKDNSWNEAAAGSKDEDNGMPYNTETNPCMLIKSTVGNAGAIYDSSLLTDDDLADLHVTGQSATTTDSGGTVSGTVQELAQKILDLKVNLQGYSDDPATDSKDRSLVKQQVEDLAAGKKANTTQIRRCSGGHKNADNKTTSINVKILEFLIDLQQSGVQFQVNTLAGQCHVADSEHYKGNAVDFECSINISAADKIGKKYGVSRNSETCSANGHWHYRITGG